MENTCSPTRTWVWKVSPSSSLLEFGTHGKRQKWDGWGVWFGCCWPRSSALDPVHWPSSQRARSDDVR